MSLCPRDNCVNEFKKNFQHVVIAARLHKLIRFNFSRYIHVIFSTVLEITRITDGFKTELAQSKKSVHLEIACHPCRSM